MPAVPPVFSRVKMRSVKSSSVLVVLSWRLSLMSPLSMLPVKGGLAMMMS